MAIWYDKLYTGSQAAKMYKSIHRSIEKEKYIKDVYLITIAAGDNDQLDVFDSIQLYMPALKRRLQPIVGIAYGKEEAIALVQTILMDVYKITGNYHVRKFFESEMKLNEKARRLNERSIKDV